MSNSAFEIKEVFSPWQKKNVRTIVVNAHAKNFEQRSIVSAISKAKPYNRIELVGGEYLEPLSISIPLEIVGSDGEEPHIVSRNRAVTIAANCRVYFSNVSISSKTKQRDCEAVGVFDGEVFFEKCKLSSIVVAARGHVSMNNCYIQKSPSGIGIAAREEGSGVLRDCTINTHYLRCVEMNTTGIFLIENCSIYNRRKDGGDLFVATGSGNYYSGKFPPSGRVTLCQSRLYISADTGSPEGGKGGKNGVSAAGDKQAGSSFSSFPISSVEREKYSGGDPCCVVITNGAAPTIKQNILLEGDIGILLHQAGHATLTKNTIQYQRRGGIVALLPKLSQPRSTSDAQSNKIDSAEENGLSGLKIMGNNLIDHCFIGIDIHTKAIPELPSDTDAAILESCTFSPCAGGAEAFSWLELPDVASTKVPSSSSVSSVASMIKENSSIIVPVHGSKVNVHHLQYLLRALAVMALQIFRWCLNPEFGKRTGAASTRVSAQTNGNYFSNQLLHSLGLNIQDSLMDNTSSSISTMVEKISISSTIFNRCGLCAIRFGHHSYGSVEQCTFDENYRHAIIVGSGACPIITGCTFTKCSDSAILVGGYANPLVIGNHMVDGDKNAIEVTTLGRGIYMSNYISTFMGVGVEVSNWSDPLICGNMIKRNAGGGIKVNTNSSPVISLNVLSVNSIAQIHVSSRSFPFIVRNSIQSGLGVGMLFTSSSKGVVRKNHLISNKLGVLVETHADPEILNNIIEKNSDVGITVRQRGLGTICSNDIVSNGTNVIIMDGGDCVLRGNTISKGAQGGVVVRKKGNGTIEKNHLKENGVANLLLTDVESHALCVRNSISGSSGCGVIVANKGCGFFARNQIYENSYCGVYVVTEANPEFVDNHISREVVGILVSEDGKGEIKKNAVDHIYGIGLMVQRRGAPMAKENRFSLCDFCALQIGIDSSGLLEQNVITNSFFGVQIGSSLWPEKLNVSSAYFSSKMAANSPSRGHRNSGRNEDVQERSHSVTPKLPPIVIRQNDITENCVAGILVQCTVNCQLEENKIFQNSIFGVLGDSSYWERQDEDNQSEKDREFSGKNPSSVTSFFKVNKKIVPPLSAASVRFVKNHIFQHPFANIYFSHFEEKGVKLIENTIFDSPVGMAVLRYAFVEETTGNRIHHCVDGIQVMKGGTGSFCGNRIEHCSHVGVYISENGAPAFKSGNQIEYCRLCGVLCDVGASGTIRQSTIRQCGIGVWVMCAMDSPFQHPTSSDTSNVPYSHFNDTSLSILRTTSAIEENIIAENVLHGVALLSTRGQEMIRPVPECAIPSCVSWKEGKKERSASSVSGGTPLPSSFLSLAEYKPFIPHSTSNSVSAANLRFSKNVIQHNRFCGFYMDRIDTVEVDLPLRFHSSVKEKSMKATSDAILGTSLLGTSREHLDERAKQQPYLVENRVEGCSIGMSVGPYCHPLLERNVLKHNLFFGLLLRPHSAAMAVGCEISDNGLAGVYACQESKGTLCGSHVAHNCAARLQKCTETAGEESMDSLVSTTALATVLVMCENELRSPTKAKELTTDIPKSTLAVKNVEVEEFLFFPKESPRKTSTPNEFQSLCYQWLTDAEGLSVTDCETTPSATTVNTKSPSDASCVPSVVTSRSTVLFKWMMIQCGAMASLTSVVCTMITSVGFVDHNIITVSAVLPPRPSILEKTYVGDDGVRDKYGFLPSNRPSPRQVHLLQGGIGIWMEQSSRTTIRQNTICEHHQVGVFVGTGMYTVFSQLQIALQKSKRSTSIRDTSDENNKVGETFPKKEKVRVTEATPSAVAKNTLSSWNNAATAYLGIESGDKGWALLLFFTTESSSCFMLEQKQLWKDSAESLRSATTTPSPPICDTLSVRMTPGLKTPGAAVEPSPPSDSLHKSNAFRKGGVKGLHLHEGNEHHPSMLVENNCVTGNAEGIHVQVLHTVRAVVHKSSFIQSPIFDPVSSPKAEENDKRPGGVLGRRFFPRFALPEGKQGMMADDEGGDETAAEMDRKQDPKESVVVVIRENRVFDNTKVGVYAEHFMEVQCQDVFESSTSLWNTVVTTGASQNELKEAKSTTAFVFPPESPLLVDTKDFPFVLPAAVPSSRRSAIICENDIYCNKEVQVEVTSQYAVVSKDQAKSLVEMSTFLDPSNVKNKFSSSQFLCRVPAIAALLQRSIPGTIHLHNNHFHDSDCGLRCFGVLCANNVRVYRNEFFRFEREAVAVLGHLSALTAGPGNVFHENQIAVHIHVNVPRRESSLSNKLDYETKVFKCVFSAQRQQSVRIMGMGETPARVDDNTFTGHGKGAVAMLLLTPSTTSVSSSAGSMDGVNGTSFHSVTVSNNTFAYNYLPLVVMGEEGPIHSGINSHESTMTLPSAAMKEEQEGEESGTVTKNLSSPFRRSIAAFSSFQEKPKPIIELLVISRNDFSFNVIGALICNGASLRLVRNLFFRNSRAGLEVSGLFTCPVIEECVFLQNSNVHNFSSEKNEAKKEQKSNDGVHPDHKSGPLGQQEKGKISFSISCTKSFLSVQHVSPSRFEWEVLQKDIVIRGVPLPISISPIHQYCMGDHVGKHTLSCGILLNPGSQCTVTRCQFDQNDVGVDAVRCIVVSKDEKLALFTNNIFQHHFVAGVMVRFCETASIRESAALLARGSFPKETTRFESNFFLDNSYDTEKGFGDAVGREFGTAVFRGNLFCGMVHGMENGYVWLDSNYFLPESSTSQSADAAIVLHHATKLMGTKNIIGKRKIGIESQEDSAAFMTENIIMECATGIRSLYLSKTRFSKNRILGSTAAAMVVYSGELDENEIVFSKDGIVVRDVTSTKVTHVIPVNRRHEGKPKIHRNRLYSCEKEGILVGTPAEIIGNMVQDSNVGIHLIPFHVKLDKENEDEWNLVRSNFVLMNFIGLLVEEKAMSLIKDNDVFDNASVGVSVAANASGALHGNRISTNKEEDAVVISTASKLRVSNNTIRHRFSPVFNRVPHNCRFKEMSAFLQGVVEEMEEYNKGWGDMVGQERNLEQSFSRLDIGSCAETSFSTFVIDSSSISLPNHSVDSSERGLRSQDFLAGSPTLVLRHKSLGSTFHINGSLKGSIGSSIHEYNYRTTNSGAMASHFRSLSLTERNKSIEEASLEPLTPTANKILNAGSVPVATKQNATDLYSPFMNSTSDGRGRKSSQELLSPSATTSEDVPPQSSSPVVPGRKFGSIRTSFSSPSLSETFSAPHRSSSGQILPVKEGGWKPPKRFVLPSTLSAIENGFNSTTFGASGKSTLITRARESAIVSAQAARAKEAERLRNETIPLLLHILARPSGQKEADQWGKALSNLLTKPPLDKINFRVFVSTSKEALCHTMDENPPEVLLLLVHPSCSGPSSSLEREVLSFIHIAAANGHKSAVHGSGRASSIQSISPSTSSPGTKRNSIQCSLSARPHRLSSSVLGLKFTLGLFSEKQVEEDSEFSKNGINASIASLFDEGNNGLGSTSPMSLSAFSAAHRTLMYSNSVDELHTDVVYLLQKEFKPEMKPSSRVSSLLLSTSAFSFGNNSFASNFSPVLEDSISALTPTALSPSKSVAGNAGGVRRKVGGDRRPSTGGERRFTLEDVAQLMSLIDPKSTIDPKEERRKKKKKKKEEEKQLLIAKEKEMEEEAGEEERSEKEMVAPAPQLSLSDVLLPSSGAFDSTIEKKKKFKKVKNKASPLVSPRKAKGILSKSQKNMPNALADCRNESVTSSTSIAFAGIPSALLSSAVEKKKPSTVHPPDQ